MKLTARNAADFLRKPDANGSAVLIYGPDEGQVRERYRQVLKTLVSDASDPFAVEDIDEAKWKEDPTCIYDAMASISLLGGRRVIVLRDAGDKAAAAIEPALALGAGNYLIVTAGELGPRSSLRSLFEAHARAAALPCYKDEAADVAGLIRRRLETAGVRALPGAVEYLSQHLGNDRGVTQAELDKILLYLGEEKTLSPETAEALVGHNRDATLDQVALAVADRSPRQVDRHLTQALRAGFPAVAVLRAVQKHFQRLYNLRADIETGKTAAQAVAAIKPPVFFRLVPSLTAQAESWPRNALSRALALLNEAETESKSNAPHVEGSVNWALQRIAAMGGGSGSGHRAA